MSHTIETESIHSSTQSEKSEHNTMMSLAQCRIGDRINKELCLARHLLNSLPPAVSIYGGTRVKETDEAYAQAFELARMISASGIPVISGGGPGIMEAANKGARAGEHGKSVGLTIQLPFETPNQHHDISLEFEHFASRKITFCRNSRAFVCMAGGVGTLDELFEVMTLVQTGKMAEIPIILFGQEFWGGLVNWLHQTVLARGLVSEKDLKHRITLVDSVEEAMTIIRNSDPTQASSYVGIEN